MNRDFARHVSRRIFLINIIANASGAALTVYYFTNLDNNAFQISAIWPTTGIFVSGVMTLGLLILGNNFMQRRIRPLISWLSQLPDAPAGTEPSSEIRRSVLELPLISAGINLIMWLLAGIFIGLMTATSDTFSWSSLLRTFFGTSVISGISTTILIYFAVEQTWQSTYLYFFPKGDVTQTPALRLSVRWRLLILFSMGLMPLLLLAAASYTVTGRLIDAPQPLDLIERFRGQAVFIISVSLVGIVMLALTLGTSLVEPLEKLGRQMAAVQRGDLDVSLPASSNDEYGQLIAGFNSMLAGLRQEEVIRRLFGRYVTPQVANYAIQHGAELGGQVMQASVLFADIRGFTGLTERVEPAALIEMLNRYFETMASVISRYGGLVNKFGGDSLLALFNSPLNPDSQHADQAVRAAQGLIGALDGFNRIQTERGEPTLEIGVGVATGAVVVGNVGSRERLEYTALGNTVNLAARLQAMTRTLERPILLDETTAQAVAAWAGVESIGQVEVRGKADPQWVYALKGTTPPDTLLAG